MKKRKSSLELLNFEGPVLTAWAVDGEFNIIDEDKKTIAIFPADKLLAFIDAKRAVTDSRGRTWCYADHSPNVRVSKEEALAFIESNRVFGERSVNFKELLHVVSSKLKIVNYSNGDLSDLGNEVGIALGSHLSEMTEGEIQQFIAGFRHGVSLTNNTH